MPFEADKTQLPGDSSGSSSLSAGQEFGQYRVIRPLGRGGMGEVYEVEHAKLGSRHAIKLINEDIVERATVSQRFDREAKVMARLKHPNIVHVDDFGETDGRTWLRMELIQGGAFDPSNKWGVESGEFNSLGDMLNSKPLPEALVIELLKQILGGLSYAHDEGVVHRDLKPSNILLDGVKDHSSPSAIRDSSSSPKVKVTDFGLVRLAGEQWLQSQVQLTVARSMADPEATRLDSESGSAGTSTEAMLGTFEFMAPEQKKGQEADARSDLYAIGLIAFRMLTGEDSPGFEMPSQLVPGLNPDWDSWVIQSLKGQPDARFESAQAMLKALPDGNEQPLQPVPATSASINLKSGLLLWLCLFVGLVVFGGGAAYYFSQEDVEDNRGDLVEVIQNEPIDRLPEESVPVELEQLSSAAEVESIPAIAALNSEPESVADASNQEPEPIAAPDVAPVGGIAFKTIPTGATVNIGTLISNETSPINISDVPVDDYEVVVKKAGYQDWSRKVRVSAGNVADIGTVRLTALPGSVLIESNPSGADVFRHGRLLGTTPMEISNVAAGSSFSCRLSLEGYHSAELSSAVLPGEEVNLGATLEKIVDPVVGKDASFLLTGEGSKFALKWIPAGSFIMGSPAEEPGHSELHPNIEMQHKVNITKGYWLGVTEVTQGQWETVMGTTISDLRYKKSTKEVYSLRGEGLDFPIYYTSWHDAKAFCKKLTKLERAAGRLPAGYEYSLPTEAQWEYACRAGTTGAYSGNLDDMAWYGGNNKAELTYAVGQKEPNPWGLYDMYGNVWEWCSDGWDHYSEKEATDPTGPVFFGTQVRVTRGGGWGTDAEDCRSASRNTSEPDTRSTGVGFRVALSSVKR